MNEVRASADLSKQMALITHSLRDKEQKRRQECEWTVQSEEDQSRTD
jgi:hypothetical protein